MYRWIIVVVLVVLVALYVYAQVRSRECIPKRYRISGWINYGEPDFSKPSIGWLVSFRRVVYFNDYTTDKIPFGRWIKYLRLQHFVSGYAQQSSAVTFGHRTWITYRIVVKAEPEVGVRPEHFGDEASRLAEQVHKALQHHVDGGGIQDRFEPRDASKWNIEVILRSSSIKSPHGLKVEIQKPTPLPLPRTQPNFSL